MALSQSIFAFELPGGLIVTRTVRGVLVDGDYVKGATSTFKIRAAVQPAVEISRVTAGRDLLEHEQGQQVYDVRIFHTNTALVDVRNPTQDPDTITGYEGGDWTVVRAEPWDFYTGPVNDKFWKVVISRKMSGGS